MTAAAPRLRKGLPRVPDPLRSGRLPVSVCPAWLETEGTGEGSGLEALARAVRCPRGSPGALSSDTERGESGTATRGRPRLAEGTGSLSKPWKVRGCGFEGQVSGTQGEKGSD